MNVFKSMILLFCVLFSFSCNTHEDNTKRNAVVSFLIACRGGSVSACYGMCNSDCGIAPTDSVTPTSLPCVSTCQSACQTGCSYGSLFLTLTRK